MHDGSSASRVAHHAARVGSARNHLLDARAQLTGDRVHGIFTAGASRIHVRTRDVSAEHDELGGACGRLVTESSAPCEQSSALSGYVGFDTRAVRIICAGRTMASPRRSINSARFRVHSTARHMPCDNLLGELSERSSPFISESTPLTPQPSPLTTWPSPLTTQSIPLATQPSPLATQPTPRAALRIPPITQATIHQRRSTQRVETLRSHLSRSTSFGHCKRPLDGAHVVIAMS
jgi:hypothetical protein